MWSRDWSLFSVGYMTTMIAFLAYDRGAFTEGAYNYYTNRKRILALKSASDEYRLITKTKTFGHWREGLVVTRRHVEIESYDLMVRFQSAISSNSKPIGLTDWMADLGCREKVMNTRMDLDINCYDDEFLLNHLNPLNPPLLLLINYRACFKSGYNDLFLSLFNTIVDRGGLKIMNDPRYAFLYQCYIFARDIFYDEIMGKHAKLIDDTTWNFKEPRTGCTLLMHAISYKDVKTVKFLLGVSDLEITNTDGRNALDIALSPYENSKTKRMVLFAYYIEFVKNREPKVSVTIQTTGLLPPLVAIVSEYLFDSKLQQRILSLRKNIGIPQPNKPPHRGTTGPYC